MVEQVITKMILPVFRSCAEWTDRLFASVSGKGVVLGVFLIVLVIGLLFVPLRGGNLVASWDDFRDFNKSVIHKGKYQRGSVVGTRSKVSKGKFQKGNNTSALIRKSRHKDL